MMTGLSLDTFDRINRDLASAPVLRQFVEQERHALRILTSSAGGVQPPTVANVTALIDTMTGVPT